MQFQIDNKEYIELNKLLKILNLVESGGQANMFITEGEAIVNNEIETRKRKKLRVGDIIEFNGYTIEITK
ncbi:MAG: RNA-binding protein [Bacteroidetes bacterium]|nr:MAG: RNA-binding protein [Bacteroidota bacterium]